MLLQDVMAWMDLDRISFCQSVRSVTGINLLGGDLARNEGEPIDFASANGPCLA